MKRRIPDLHGERQMSEGVLDGAFLVRVDRVFFRWHLPPAASAVFIAQLPQLTQLAESSPAYCRFRR